MSDRGGSARAALGRFGVWGAQLRAVDDPGAAAVAGELEQLGYTALWFPGGNGTRPFDIAAGLLRATSTVTVATGIVSIWATSAEQTSTGFAAMEATAPGRFLLGLGVSHAALVDRNEPGRYSRPLAAMRQYLAAVADVPVERRIIAALGPRMLELAAAGSLGTHPYLVTPDMTRGLRERLPDGVVAVEQAFVLDGDVASARAKARAYLAMYLALPNYTDNWLRHGYSAADLADGGSDRLVDDLVVHGGVDDVVGRAAAHWSAGADHVCLQAIGGADPTGLADLQRLAPALHEAAATVPTETTVPA